MTKARLKEYILVPSNEFNLINLFINTLQKGSELISLYLIMYEVAFEQLNFPQSNRLLSAYEVWTQYFQDIVERRI